MWLELTIGVLGAAIVALFVWAAFEGRRLAADIRAATNDVQGDLP